MIGIADQLHTTNKLLTTLEKLVMTFALALIVSFSHFPAAFCGGGSFMDSATSIQSVVPRADREAILAMAGAYRVTFRFEETVAISSDYVLEVPYVEHATELVQVIADEGDYISLQHLLVIDNGPDKEPFVVKHWRQDWRYEDTQLLTYKGHAMWQREERTPSEVRGTWTQAVYQTTDAPRYEAVGKWTHLPNQSSWESELTWRPLPRRERRRQDYHVVVCRNRHTLTPDGWVHEQDNQKLTLTEAGEPVGVIAHEMGLNSYERISETEVAAATKYWREHEAAWAEIRAAWLPLLERDTLALRRHVGGDRLNDLIDDAIENDAIRATLSTRLAAYVIEDAG